MSALHPRPLSFLSLSLFSLLTPDPAATPEPGLADARARPLPLTVVRLLDSPFKDAQDRDAKFQAHPGNFAGGVFDVIMLKAQAHGPICGQMGYSHAKCHP